MLVQVNAGVNARLDEMLRESEIDFDKPVHPVHRMNREQLLEQVAVCSDTYYGDPDPEFIGISAEDLTDDQLRKLALWLYEEVGGTHSAV